MGYTTVDLTQGETHSGMDKTNREILGKMYDLVQSMRRAKPEDRSELARMYAVTITDLEKIVAYFELYAVEDKGV